MVIAVRRKKPSGREPLPANPMQWQSLDIRGLAAIFQKHADRTGDDMAQVEADALYQAQKIGVFGVHRRYLDRIQKAAAFNLESRPHASIPGSVPVGEPKEHANLARTAERLLAVSEQLKTAANGQLRALKAGSQGSEIVTAWLKGKKTGYERLSMIERSRKVISDYSDELKNNNGRSECQCMVCRKIADNLRWSEKVERDTGAIFAAIQDAIEEAKYRETWGHQDLPMPPTSAPRSTGIPDPTRRGAATTDRGGRRRRDELETELLQCQGELAACRQRAREYQNPQRRLEDFQLTVNTTRRERELLIELVSLNDGGAMHEQWDPAGGLV